VEKKFKTIQKLIVLVVLNSQKVEVWFFIETDGFIGNCGLKTTSASSLVSQRSYLVGVLRGLERVVDRGGTTGVRLGFDFREVNSARPAHW
jgi:microsomal dipeptidase-like Zn-dependent dipeptidase